jgi:hypothetical protein
MNDADLENLRSHVVRLRTAIDRARTEHPGGMNLPFIGHWPKDCCDSPYLFLLLYDLGCRGMIRKYADVSHFGKGFEKHVWIVVDGITIDISADQFPGVSDGVIVTRHSPWHEALRLIEEWPWASDREDDLYERYVKSDCYTVYREVLPIYAPPVELP